MDRTTLAVVRSVGGAWGQPPYKTDSTGRLRIVALVKRVERPARAWGQGQAARVTALGRSAVWGVNRPRPCHGHVAGKGGNLATGVTRRPVGAPVSCPGSVAQQSGRNRAALA
ncbi:hypothetical protein GCM10023263_82680 [Phytohabitans rumicis]